MRATMIYFSVSDRHRFSSLSWAEEKGGGDPAIRGAEPHQRTNQPAIQIQLSTTGHLTARPLF